MASADDYAAWIVANQGKKGTPEFDTVAKAYQEAKGVPAAASDPTEGMGGVEKFRAGMGKALADTYRGASQLLRPTESGPATPQPATPVETPGGAVTANPMLLRQGANRGNWQTQPSGIQAEIDEAKKRDAPLMTGAGVAGNIAGNLIPAVATALIPGANTVTGATLAGAVMGAGQPVATGESRTANATTGALGGMVGQGVGNVLARGIRPVANNLTPEEARLVGVALNEGIPIDAAAQTGSRPLKTLNSVFENLPFTSGPQIARGQATQEGFNAAALRRAGINETAASPDVLATQRAALGRSFQDIAGRNTLNFNQGLAHDIGAIGDTATRRVANGGTVRDTVDDILAEAPNGVMPGAKYQGWREELGRLSRGNGTEAHYFGEVRRALDNAFGAQVPAADAEAWRLTSREYANLKTIMNAMGGAGNAPNAGNIAPAQLARALSTSVGREGKALGRGDLNDISRVGQLFVKDNIPNSGTAQRQLYQALLTGGGGAGLGAGGAYATGNDPLKGAAAGAAITGAGLAGPRLAQALINSAPAQAYLTRQAGNPTAQRLAEALQIAARATGTALPLTYAGQE